MRTVVHNDKFKKMWKTVHTDKIEKDMDNVHN